MTESSQNNVPVTGINLGIACIPSCIDTNRASTPGFEVIKLFLFSTQLRAFPGKSIWVGWNWPEFFSSWCWGSESFRFLGGGGEAYFSFLGGRVKFEK